MKIVADAHGPFLLILLGASLLNFSLSWSPRYGRNKANGCSYETQKRGKFLSASTTDGTTDDHASSAGGIPSTSSNNRNTATRRDAVLRTFTTLIGGVTASTALLSSSATIPSLMSSSTPTPTRFGWVGAAHADVTNKVASTTALRAMTRAQSQLPTKLLPDAQANNFVGVKARLREPPFDLVRKNGLVLVRGGEDGPKAKELVRSYKGLIAALEKIDATASLGMRGRSIGPLEMIQEYEDIVLAMNSFVKVGEDASEIPLQESPSMQDNLRTGSIETKVLRGD